MSYNYGEQWFSIKYNVHLWTQYKNIINMERFLHFYKSIICKKRFYLPILFYSIVAYSFSIYNRTISIDGLLGDYTVGDSGCSMLSGRWGMVVWCRLLDIMGFDPFIDRFLALLFLIIAAVLFCYILYSIGGSKDILQYSITASIFITYPLINEIWEYVGADFMVGGNLCLVSLAAIAIKETSSALSLKRILLASFLLLLPMSSYETGVFYYIALVGIIIFYEDISSFDSLLHVSDWIKKNLYYFIPLVIAFVLRFTVSFIINTVFDLEYSGGGDTKIIWLEYSFIPTLKGVIVSNFLHYVVYGLVYFPIAVFGFSLLNFIVYALSIKGNRLKHTLLGIIVIISLFSLAILQGDLLMYRHAQTITLFVAFSVYLVCMSIRIRWRIYIYALLFGLCWYQAIYMNRLLGLNNLRSDNELSIIRMIGSRIVSEYERKPVFVVAPYQVSEWIHKQITVDESAWNGRLFYYICEKLGDSLGRPHKYIYTNVNCASEECIQLKLLFSYCGYDINIIPDFYSDVNLERDKRMWAEAILVAKEMKLKPFQIHDNGNYLILSLGEDFYGSELYK